jgi:hypothetical protein
MYDITYIQNNEQIILEWVVPTGWSTAAIRESFERQFSQAVIIRIEAMP